MPSHRFTLYIALALAGCEGTDSIDHEPDAGSCSPETDAALCARLEISCGPARRADNCGTTRAVNCGTCDFDARCRTACNVAGGAQNCTSVDFNSCVNQCGLETSGVSEACGECIVEHTSMLEVLGACSIQNGANDAACNDACTSPDNSFTGDLPGA